MPRATSSPARNKRKKKILKAAKGYFGGRKNLYGPRRTPSRRVGNTLTGTARTGSARSVGSGSRGSMPRPERTSCPTPDS